MTTPVTQWYPGMSITAGRLQYMLERLAESLSVTAFGATGDGTTDDAPAIQEALDQAAANGGGWVVVPPGTYLLSTLPLRIYSDTRLTLLPGAEMRRNMAETLIVNGDADQDLGGYTGQSRITIEGGLWNMRGTTTGLTSSAMCLHFGHGSDITVRDLEVRDVPGYHAVELNSIKRGTVENCVFRGYIDPGSRDFSEAIQLDLAKSSGTFGAFGPWDHTPCEDILIQGCYFGPSDTAGTTAWPRGIGSHSATITKYHSRVRIVGCTFEDLVQYACSLYNYEDTVVTGCTFTNCGSGVRFRTVITSDTEDTKDPDGVQTSASQDMRNLTVTGCTFRNGGSYDEPIVALGESTGIVLGLSITGCAIDDSDASENGIRLQYVSRAVVSGCTVSNIDGTGISTESCGNLILADNQIWTVGAHGITLVDDDHSSVVGCQIREPGSSGILVQGGNNIHLRDNYIKSPSRSANGTHYGIRASTSVSSLTLSGNKTRPHGSGNEASHGCSISSSCSLIHRYGNDWRGAEFTVAALADGSTTPNTSATDIT